MLTFPLPKVLVGAGLLKELKDAGLNVEFVTAYEDHLEITGSDATDAKKADIQNIISAHKGVVPETPEEAEKRAALTELKKSQNPDIKALLKVLDL